MASLGQNACASGLQQTANSKQRFAGHGSDNVASLGACSYYNGKHGLGMYRNAR